MIKMAYIEPLTPMELKVFDLLARGYKAREIGDILNRSRRTVESHVQSCYQKTGCQSRADAFMFFWPIWVEKILDEQGAYYVQQQKNMATIVSGDSSCDCAGVLSVAGIGPAAPGGHWRILD